MARALVALLALCLSVGGLEATAPSLRYGVEAPWGRKGHEIAAREAVRALPDEMPRFFRGAGDRLAFLVPEPDSWRTPQLVEMVRAFDYDHYVDLENVPDAALEAPDRFTYLRMLYETGLERPEQRAGFLPFRMVELYQRLVTQWRRWEREGDPRRRSFLEARILDDAGILGHYVTDGSQPHHTTIHFNGWDDAAPNPQGYSTEPGFHARFETAFVNAHVEPADVRSHMPQQLRSVAGSARPAVFDFVRASHAEVETLYRLDRDIGFDPRSAPDPATKAFAARRLAAGAEMLAVLWWSAFLEGTSD